MMNKTLLWAKSARLCVLPSTPGRLEVRSRRADRKGLQALRVGEGRAERSEDKGSEVSSKRVGSSAITSRVFEYGAAPLGSLPGCADAMPMTCGSSKPGRCPREGEVRPSQLRRASHGDSIAQST